MIHIIQKIAMPRKIREIEINEQNKPFINDLSLPVEQTPIYNTENLLVANGNILSGLTPELIESLKIIKNEPVRHINPDLKFKNKLKQPLLITFNGYKAIELKPFKTDVDENGTWDAFTTNEPMGISQEQVDSIMTNIKYSNSVQRHENYIAIHQEFEFMLANRMFNSFEKLLRPKILKIMEDFRTLVIDENNPYKNSQSFITMTIYDIGMELLEYRMKKSNKTFNKKRSILRELRTTLYQKAISISKLYWKKFRIVYSENARIQVETETAKFRALILMEFKRLNNMVCEEFSLEEIVKLSLKSFCVLNY